MANLLALVAPELCGIIRQRYIRCGKTNCRCRQGQLHGPYHILQYRVYKHGKGWVKASKYVSAADVERIEKELLSARQFTKKAMNERYQSLKQAIKSFEVYVEEALKDGIRGQEP